jgi:hypothetical protein
MIKSMAFNLEYYDYKTLTDEEVDSISNLTNKVRKNLMRFLEENIGRLQIRNLISDLGNLSPCRNFKNKYSDTLGRNKN